MEKTTNMPLLGDNFPTLEVNTTHGPMTLPKDMKGKWFILFSHPADFTPVCTTEFIGFQKIQAELKKMNTELIGFSIDQVFAHINWVRWIKEKMDVEIKFPVIAGNDDLATKLGMLHPGKGSNTVRAVFIIDPKGKTDFEVGITNVKEHISIIGNTTIDTIYNNTIILESGVSGGVGEISYRWYKKNNDGDFVLIDNEYESELKLEYLTYSDAGDYKVVATNYDDTVYRIIHVNVSILHNSMVGLPESLANLLTPLPFLWYRSIYCFLTPLVHFQKMPPNHLWLLWTLLYF